MKYLLICCMILFTAGQEQSVKVDDFSIRMLTQHIDGLINDHLGFTAMQEKVKLLDYQTSHYEGHVIAEKFAKQLAAKLSQLKEDLLDVEDSLKYFAEEIISPKKLLGNFCCAAFSSEGTFHDGHRFRANINSRELCMLMTADASPDSRKISSKMLRFINANFEEHSFLEKQYLISQNSLFVIFPTKDTSCNAVNSGPRLKPWFVQTLSLKKRHVIVLLDTSYSMSYTHDARTLLKLSTDAIEFLLESALPTTEIDIVAFNDSGTVFPNCGRSSNLQQEFNSRHSALKKRFLSDLTAGGQSYFVDGFRRAFQLFASKANNTTADAKQLVILLISDGGASETFNNKTHEIYQTIADGNRGLNDAVRIFTYGVGRSDVNMDLLKDIAKQDFHEALGLNRTKKETSGKAFRINEPDMLGYLLQSFYDYLDDNGLVNTPVISPPFLSSDGGVMVTSVIHMYNNHTDVDAILAADISLEKLIEEELYLDNHQHSYFFVIGKDGVVLSHPSLSNFDGGNEFDMPHIEQLEPFWEVHNLVSTMTSGHAGGSPVITKRQPQDLDMMKQVNYTYYWHPITGTDFTICFVKELFDHSVFITPEYAISGCVDGNEVLPASLCSNMVISKFHYHKFIGVDNIGTCNYFKKPTTVKGSVVKFSPQSYKSSIFDIDGIETAARIKVYESFFNQLFNATSFTAAQYMLSDIKYSRSIHDSLQDGVVADVLWTAIVDNIWMKNFQSCIARRFIATNSGIVRFFPGTRLSSTYDPLKREWYRSAASHHSVTMVSAPYEDAAGAGIVITFSQAINKPRFYTGNFNNKVLGVLGLDIHPFCLETTIIRLYPKCANDWLCSVVNWDGLIIHQINQRERQLKIKERSRLPDHLIYSDGGLAQLLLNQGSMRKVRCFDIATRRYKISYKVLQAAQLNTMRNRNMCARYVVEHIPHTNAFFVARERHDSCYYKTCLRDGKECTSNNECVNMEIWPNSQCECPCTMEVHKDPCSLPSEHQWNDTIICAPTSHKDVQSSYCLTEHVDPCFNTSVCRNVFDPLQCAERKGCVWCISSEVETLCENVQDCFEKSYLSGISEDEGACHPKSSSSNSISSIVIASTSAFGSMCVIILFLVLFYCSTLCRGKESYQFPKAEAGDLMVTDGDTITAVTWNEIQNDGSNGAVRNSQSDVSRIHDQHPTAVNSQKVPREEKIGTSMMPSGSDVTVPESSVTYSGGKFHQHTQPRKRTRVIDQKKTAKLKSLTAPLEDTRPHFSSSSTGTVNVRPRHPGLPTSNISTHVKKNKTAAVKESNAVTKLFQSVLKKRADKGFDIQSSNEIYMENFSAPFNNDTSYFKMFAEPADNEGDIPIIQSDNSDNESLKNVSKL